MPLLRRGLAALAVVVGCGAPQAPLSVAIHPTAERAPAESVAPSGPLAELGWLAGQWWSWDAEHSRCTVEMWMTPAGTSMVGASRTVAGGETVAWEHIRIEARAEATVYVARPSGQVGAEFRLTDSGAHGEGGRFVVFENPEHDFPIRIRYTRAGDLLTARIEGREPEQASEWQLYPAAQSPCPR